MLHPLQSQLVEGTAWLDPFVQDFRTRFLTLLAGAFRGFAPALALTILDPQLTFSEAQTERGVTEGQAIRKADGSPMSAYDLKRLQVRLLRLVAAWSLSFLHLFFDASKGGFPEGWVCTILKTNQGLQLSCCLLYKNWPAVFRWVVLGSFELI